MKLMKSLFSKIYRFVKTGALKAHQYINARLFRKEDDGHEFKPLLVEIEESPRHPLGGAIFWIVMTILLFAFLWMFFGKVDVVVTAHGKIIPVGEIKILQPLTTGVVRNIMVKEGDFVQKGQVLMEIDPSTTQPELDSMKANYSQLCLESERIDALLDNTPFQPNSAEHDPAHIRIQEQIYRSSLECLKDQIQIKKEELVQIEEQLASAQKDRDHQQYLLNLNADKCKRMESVKDIISRDEFDKMESEYKTIEKDLTVAEHRISELKAAGKRVLKEIDFIQKENQNKLLMELSEKQKNQTDLKGTIEKTTYLNSKQQITAPVRGHINKLLIHTIGGVVTPAEKLISLVPADSTLIIKALVQNKDVGFIAPDMDAGIKVDTFNFQKYGLLKGKVKQISRDSLEDEKLGLVYEVYVTPEETTLMVEGVETQIAVGMSVTVEIKVGKRRIIEFFIYPVIKYLDEGISVR